MPTSAAVDHSGPRGAVAQQKHSLATSSCFFSAFLFLIWLHTYGTGDNLAFWSHCQRDSCKDRAFKIRTTQQNRRAVISFLHHWEHGWKNARAGIPRAKAGVMRRVSMAVLKSTARHMLWGLEIIVPYCSPCSPTPPLPRAPPLVLLPPLPNLLVHLLVLQGGAGLHPAARAADAAVQERSRASRSARGCSRLTTANTSPPSRPARRARRCGSTRTKR